MKKKNSLEIKRSSWEILMEYKKANSKKRYQEILKLDLLGC